MSSLADYFNSSHIVRSSKSLPNMGNIQYTLYRDGEPVLYDGNMDSVLQEMDTQINLLLSLYHPPENLITVERMEDGVRIFTRDGNSLTSYDSILAEFVVVKN
jgi:hypothetical protein